MDNASYSRSLLDLPVADILVDHVAPYLTREDLTTFRTCSRKCKELADQMFAGIRKLVFSCGNEGPIPLILQTCRQLRTIELYHVTWSNDQVHQLMSNNLLLDTVNIFKCKQITSRGLVPLIACNKIQHLQLVHVDIHDEFLIEFANNNKNLKEANFGECFNFSVEALQHFFHNEPELKHIEIDELRDFDISPILITISQSCFNLKYLCVYNSILRDTDVLKNFARPGVVINIKFYDDDSDDSDNEMANDNCGITWSYAKTLRKFKIQVEDEEYEEERMVNILRMLW
ncbi:F-box/LRR-repeat protein 15-like [Lutzomyia longipalpis]|uniref:F-box/LRR-repeat protein 15-like n=1 Tax=Lutzomyia longipalpis TaxID=7200 RepID=UPI002484114C|nr:F-box/LRR-repeat protein 15-like [Lutzomyia longipalpis]